MAGSGRLASRYVYIWCRRWVAGLAVSVFTDFLKGLLMCLPMTFFWLLPGGRLFPSYVVGKNVPTRRKNQLSCSNYTFMRNNCCAGKDSTHTNSLRTIVDTPRKLAKNKNNNNNGNLERTYTQESYSNSTFMRNSRKSRVLIKRMKSLALIKRPILKRERGTFLHWKSKHKTARARLPAWLISRNILWFVMRWGYDWK